MEYTVRQGILTRDRRAVRQGFPAAASKHDIVYATLAKVKE